ALSDQARFFAQSTALEIQRTGGRDIANIIARRQTNASGQYPDMSIAVVPLARACGDASPAGSAPQAAGAQLQAQSGPWTHLDPPRSIPAWIDCSGFSGVLAYTHRRGPARPEDTHLLVRGVAFPDSPRP